MQLKDVTSIIAAIIAERDKIPRIVDRERYIPNPQPYHDGNMIRGGIRKALRIIEQSPIVDAVSVIRCNKCQSHCSKTGMCSEWMKIVEPTGFCYKGQMQKKET